MKDNKLRVLVHRQRADGERTSYFHSFNSGTFMLDNGDNPIQQRYALDDAVTWEVMTKLNGQERMTELYGPVVKMDLFLHTGDDSTIIATRHIHNLEE